MAYLVFSVENFTYSGLSGILADYRLSWGGGRGGGREKYFTFYVDNLQVT